MAIANRRSLPALYAKLYLVIAVFINFLRKFPIIFDLFVVFIPQSIREDAVGYEINFLLWNLLLTVHLCSRNMLKSLLIVKIL